MRGWGPVQGVGGAIVPYSDPHLCTDRQTDRQDWKHYLPATLLAGGNNRQVIRYVSDLVVSICGSRQCKFFSARFFFLVLWFFLFSIILHSTMHMSRKCRSRQIIEIMNGLHVLSLSPCPCPSNFIIVSMVTDCLIDRLGSEPTLSVNVNLTETGTETVRVNGPSSRKCGSRQTDNWDDERYLPLIRIDCLSIRPIYIDLKKKSKETNLV